MPLFFSLRALGLSPFFLFFCSHSMTADPAHHQFSPLTNDLPLGPPSFPLHLLRMVYDRTFVLLPRCLKTRVCICGVGPPPPLAPSSMPLSPAAHLFSVLSSPSPGTTEIAFSLMTLQSSSLDFPYRPSCYLIFFFLLFPRQCRPRPAFLFLLLPHPRFPSLPPALLSSVERSHIF